MSYVHNWSLAFDSLEELKDFQENPDLRTAVCSYSVPYTNNNKHIVDVKFKSRLWKSSVEKMLVDYKIGAEPTRPIKGSAPTPDDR